MFTLLIVIIVIALIFDLVNGFHDAANSIATVVSTKVLSPLQAVVWAAAFNVAAYFVFSMSVGNTVAKTVDNNSIDLIVILAGLIAALIWNLLTWRLGIPSSSSHTLIGGFAGAAIAHAGFDVVNVEIIVKTALFILLAPLIGGVIAFFIAVVTVSRNILIKMTIIIATSVITLFFLPMNPVMQLILGITLGIFIVIYIIYFILQRKRQSALREKNMYKKLQLLSSAAFSLGHGGADSQKVMGIICAACLVFANMQREGDSASIPRFIRVDEVIDVEDKTRSLKEEHSVIKTEANKDLYVYNFQDQIRDVETKEWIFDGEKLNPAYSKIGLFSEYADVESGTLNPKVSLKSKINSNSIPAWIPISCYLCIGIGTLFGGWRIIKTMGTKITKVTPLEGVCAETAGAITLFAVAEMGIPVSTTHTITGAIIGVGATRRASAVRWGITISLLWAWILTIPVSAILAAIIYFLIKLF